MVWVVTFFQLNNFEQFEYDLMIDERHDHVHFQIEVLRKSA